MNYRDYFLNIVGRKIQKYYPSTILDVDVTDVWETKSPQAPLLPATNHALISGRSLLGGRGGASCDTILCGSVKLF